MLADDDMTTGLVVNTDIDGLEGGMNRGHLPVPAEHRSWFEKAFNQVEQQVDEASDAGNGEDDGNDPIHGRQHEHDDGHREEPLP